MTICPVCWESIQMTSEACPWCEPYTRVGLKPTQDEVDALAHFGLMGNVEGADADLRVSV